VIYARISDDAELTGLGVARQLADCRDLAARLDLVDPIEIVDNDVSAFDTRRSRPGWKRLIELVRTGEASAILAWHTDRLYRRLTDLEALATLLESHPVAIHTVQSGDLDLSTAAGRMTARILGSVAQHESEHKSERIVRAHAQIAESGGWKGGPRPFGYLADGVTIDPVEADVARRAMQRILAGQPATRVAEWASEVLGRRITQRSLVRSLTSPHIAGFRVYWPRVERDQWNARRARGEVVGEEPAHLLITHTRPATWPPVLAEEDWRALLAIYRSSAPRPRPRRSLLAGVLRCAECDAPLGWGESRNAGVVDGLYATYRCVVNSGGCGRISIGARAVDELLSCLVRGATGEHSEQVVRAAPARGQAGTRNHRQALTSRLEELADAFGAGELSRDQHARQRQRVLSELAAMSADDDEAIDRMRRRDAAIDVIARWDSAERSERATAIRALIPLAWVFPTGRGKSWPPECRVAPVWADDDRHLSKDQLRATLVPPPAQLTDAERKARRNARDRAKRLAQKLRALPPGSIATVQSGAKRPVGR
jgi:site-specific DNA recombinase